MSRAVLALMLPVLFGQHTPAPALPYFDWKACPFEGCVYRQWTARAPVTVYDTWKEGRQVIAGLEAGDKVTGVTGVVITFKPGRIRIDRDVAAQGLKSGDVILTYTYQGEGTSLVWFKGRFHSGFDIAIAKRPDGKGCAGAECSATYLDLGRKEWWAQVKLKSGRLGWVAMDHASFDGVDMLG